MSFSQSVNPCTGVPMVVSVRSRAPVREANADVPAPRVANPVDGFGEAEAIERLFRGDD